MRVLDEICDGRHSPVLPVRVRNTGDAGDIAVWFALATIAAAGLGVTAKRAKK